MSVSSYPLMSVSSYPISLPSSRIFPLSRGGQISIFLLAGRADHKVYQSRLAGALAATEGAVSQTGEELIYLFN